MRKTIYLLAVLLLWGVVSETEAKVRVGTLMRDTLCGIPCRVYLPYQYAKRIKSKKTVFPVLYLQHGMFGNEDDWADKGRLIPIIDSLQQSDGLKEMVVIMPDNCPHFPTADEEKENAISGFWENHFAEFMAEAEQRYRISKAPAQRAIAGLSMGGYHTMRVAHELPGQFAYVGMFSPAPFIHQAPENTAAPLWLGIGKEDFLYEMVQAYRRWLEKKHIEYTYYESTGGHTWPNWQDYLVRFLKQCQFE